MVDPVDGVTRDASGGHNEPWHDDEYDLCSEDGEEEPNPSPNPPLLTWSAPEGWAEGSGVAEGSGASTLDASLDASLDGSLDAAAKISSSYFLPLNVEERFIETERFSVERFLHAHGRRVHYTPHEGDDALLTRGEPLDRMVEALLPQRTDLGSVASAPDPSHLLLSKRPLTELEVAPKRRFELIYRNYAPRAPSP